MAGDSSILRATIQELQVSTTVQGLSRSTWVNSAKSHFIVHFIFLIYLFLKISPQCTVCEPVVQMM